MISTSRGQLKVMMCLKGEGSGFFFEPPATAFDVPSQPAAARKRVPTPSRQLHFGCCRRDVALQLCFKRLHIVEPLNVSQPGEKVNLQRLDNVEALKAQ